MESEIIKKVNDKLFRELKKYPENSPQYREIESKLVKNNLRLVTYIAQIYFPYTRHSLTDDDLIAEGYLGLINAIRTFKSEKEVQFQTYAGQNIRYKILNCLKRESKNKKVLSFETAVETSNPDGKRIGLKDVLASPVNIEEDIAEKDETERQIAWIRKNLDRLGPLQKRVIIAKYLSGEASLTSVAIAKKFNCSQQNISLADITALNKLRKIHSATHPEAIKQTSGKKLTTLRTGAQSNEHLKGVSEFRSEENGKEC